MTPACILQLQEELMSMQTDSPRRQEQAAQTSPLMRRSSLSDIRYGMNVKWLWNIFLILYIRNFWSVPVQSQIEETVYSWMRKGWNFCNLQAIHSFVWLCTRSLKCFILFLWIVFIELNIRLSILIHHIKDIVIDNAEIKPFRYQVLHDNEYPVKKLWNIFFL